MPLLSLSTVRRLTPLLRPLRALAARDWLRLSEVDAVLATLHPAWRLQRVFAQVVAREWVSDDLLALHLRCNGNERRWRAGQHVQLYLELDGVRHSRSYSLTRVGEDGLVELGIRRQPDGRMSNRILDHLAEGDLLELGQADGELHWPASAAGVGLLAAGSGITALLGLLREALAGGYAAPVTLLHYVREAGQHAYVEELQRLMARHPNLQVRWLLTGQEASRDGQGGRFRAEHLAGMDGFELLACVRPTAAVRASAPAVPACCSPARYATCAAARPSPSPASRSACASVRRWAMCKSISEEMPCVWTVN